MFDELLELSLARARRTELRRRRPLARHRQLQAGQRLARPRGRRRADRAAGRAAAGGDARHRPGGAPGRRRVPDAARATWTERPRCPGRTTAPRSRPRPWRSASSRRLRDAVRGRRDGALRDARASGSACSRTTPTTPIELLKQRRHRDVPQQEDRARAATSCTRPKDADAMSRLSLSTRLRKAVEQRAMDAALPAADRARDRRDVRRRGADPLARTRRRPGAARRVHPAGRGDGPDRGDRRLGRRGDLPAGRACGAPRGSTLEIGVQPVAAAAVAARPRRQDRLAHGDRRAWTPRASRSRSPSRPR